MQIVNGQVNISASTGEPILVDGNRKCAQDLAECFLQDFLPSQQYGSYLRAIVRNQFPFATELLLRYYIAQAVNLLQALQDSDPAITDSEQITDIITLLTTPNQDGTVGFFVSVGTQDGGSSVAGVALQPTQLNQLTEAV